ncbi:MAG: RNA polymerase sigma factor [Anaerolineae bacterium]|nr:RNA polymerase sigma factor [Anaerolineae bacterium]
MANRTNEEWLTGLRSTGEYQETALADLTQIIISGLPYALTKWIQQDDPRFSSLAEEVAQETLLRVMDRLDSFEGRSQFTTWVYTIAVRVALTELRRAKWKETSLDQLMEGKDNGDEPREIPDLGVNIEGSLEKREMMSMIQKTMSEQLTEKQRTALMAVAIHGMPLEEVARRMGTERNALYKLLHDARIKLKHQMQKMGVSPEELFAVFEK